MKKQNVLAKKIANRETELQRTFDMAQETIGMLVLEKCKLQIRVLEIDKMLLNCNGIIKICKKRAKDQNCEHIL